MTFNPLVLTDARIWYAAANLTGWGNQVAMSAKPSVLDRTTFASGGWRAKGTGLFEGTFASETFWQAGDLSVPDDSFWANLGVATVPVSVAPTNGAVGDLIYLTRCLETAYTPGGQVGQDLKAKVDAETSWPITRGKILHPEGTPRTVTGNGTAVQVAAASATQAVYVCLHVFDVQGTTPSLTVAVQSDDNADMTTPTTVGTFTAATALGGQTLRIPGPVTDTWYRVTWTISGTTPSFLFGVSAGIGPK